MLKLEAKILIVDDMLTMRKMVSKIIKSAGYQNLSEADSGTSAWELVSQAEPPFDLILSDWNMPNGTGIDLLKRLRANERLSKTPMIMITAEAEKTQIVEALQNKVTDYVIKPFTLETILEKLKNL